MQQMKHLTRRRSREVSSAFQWIPAQSLNSFELGIYKYFLWKRKENVTNLSDFLVCKTDFHPCWCAVAQLWSHRTHLPCKHRLLCSLTLLRYLLSWSNKARSQKDQCNHVTLLWCCKLPSNLATSFKKSLYNGGWWLIGYYRMMLKTSDLTKNWSWE